MKKIVAILIIASLLLGLTTGCVGKKHLGLYMENGFVMKDGKPYRAIGANFFPVFMTHSGAVNGTTDFMPNYPGRELDKYFQMLKDEGVPFFRFMACMYSEEDYKLRLEDGSFVYYADMDESQKREFWGNYYEIMDYVVDMAEKYGIGLIPSMFWLQSACPKMFGEEENAWGIEDSKTRAFMREYTETFVKRYKKSPAIWGWQLGNEYNLSADLKMGEGFNKRVYYTAFDVAAAADEFSKIVRENDPYKRIITSGYAMLRPAQYNWANSGGTFNKPDSLEEMAEIAEIMHPNNMDVYGAHFYQDQLEEYRFDKTVKMVDTMAEYKKAAEKKGKGVFIGEFAPEPYEMYNQNNPKHAALGKEGYYEQQKIAEKNRYMVFMDAILNSRVDIAAVWTVNFDGSYGTRDITLKTKKLFASKKYWLELNKEYSAKMQAAVDKEYADFVAKKK